MARNSQLAILLHRTQPAAGSALARVERVLSLHIAPSRLQQYISYVVPVRRVLQLQLLVHGAGERFPSSGTETAVRTSYRAIVLH